MVDTWKLIPPLLASMPRPTLRMDLTHYIDLEFYKGLRRTAKFEVSFCLSYQYRVIVLSPMHTLVNPPP